VFLSAGEHEIEIYFQEYTGGAFLYVSWEVTTGELLTGTEYEYIGCYADDGERDLEYMADIASATADSCASHCASLGYTYFGTQWYGECFCDNNYGDYGEATNCDTPCDANSQEMCGGAWANSVYEITATGLDGDAYVCADEWETCECTGWVRYGADDTFTDWVEVDGSIECTNDVFGDPLYGTFKLCECAPYTEAGECSTVYIGSASDNSPETEVSVEYASCDPTPLNYQDPSWNDEFEIEIDGTTITVTRLDSDSGWGQSLEIECCTGSAGSAECDNGDADGSGETDILDIVVIINGILYDDSIFAVNSSGCMIGDMDESGEVDILDIVQLVNVILYG